MEKVKSRLHALHDKYGVKYIAWMTFFIIGVNIVLSSAIYYIVEDVDSWYTSVYWTVTTLSTVGYGDETPVTWMGQTVAMFNMLFGVALFPAFGALVVGVMNSMWQKKKDIENEHLAAQNARIEAQNEIIIAQNECLEKLLTELKNGK